MNQLQKAELELLRAFINVCLKLNLRYYLVCGSALGAVKYNGFIPWDDDIDVALPRQDYTVFVERAQEYLPNSFFLQNYRTDPEFPCFYCKLRDSRTTFIESSIRHRRMNHGVYIDVFPLDGYPSDSRTAQKLERAKARLNLRLASANAFSKNQKLTTKVYFMAERLVGCHRRTDQYAKKLDDLLSSYPAEESKLWCNHGNWQGAREYAPVEQYGKGIEAVFEGVSVRIPEKYDAYLTQKYGDWRADLPDEEKIGHHYFAVCDLTRPYTDYCDRKK